MTKTIKSRAVSFFVSVLLLLFTSTLLAQKVDFNADPQIVCSGSIVTFNDTSTDIPVSASYEWDFGAGASPETASGKGPHTVLYTGSNNSTVKLKVVFFDEEEEETEEEEKEDYITINPTTNIILASGSNSQTVCANSSIANITYTIGGSATGATVSGLPTGVTETFSETTLTISGTPTDEPATYDYIITTSGTCGDPVTAEGSITISPNATIELTSGNDAQTVCANSSIANITYNIGGSGTGATVSGLPTGVTETFSGTTLTISGAPTDEPATYNYTVTTTGTCGNTTATGSITISQNATIVLVSGSNAQTVCANSSIANITYTIGGSATGATVSGLPTGVTETFSGTTLTISGTPTDEPATYDYIITTSGTCGDPVTAEGSITISPNATIELTSGNDAQTVCANSSIANITYTIGGSATGATVSGLPTGVTETFSGTTLTISGTPTDEPATYDYIITTSGTCGDPVTAEGSITISPNATIELTSGNDAQTVCANSSIANITYTIGGSATGATVSGLPTGVTETFSGTTLTISGTPTDEPATYNYTVTTTGTCGNTTATGSITISQNATIVLASGSNTQTVCDNSSIANITYTIGGSGTGATVSGLPTGVSGTFSGTTFTISGTPTDEPKTYNYTVTITGTCGNPTATGSITITSNSTIILTSNNNTQAVCSNTAINNITYTIGGSGTGATVKGLPAGIKGEFSGNTLTISGTPTAVVGNYDYTVSTTGPCTNPTATGTITVGSDAAIILTSTSKDQVACINRPISNISFKITGSTSAASVTGLPSGLIGSYEAEKFTIKGTPTTSGTFNYTISVSGSCGSSSLTGTITVQTDASILLTTSNDSQHICVNSPIEDIHYSIERNSNTPSVEGLPSGVVASYSNKTLIISGTPTSSGTFNYKVLATNACGDVEAKGVLVVDPLPKATISGTANVCQFDTAPNIVFTGSIGVEPYTFYYTVNSGSLLSITSSNSKSATIAVPTDDTGIYTYTLVSVEDGTSNHCSSLQTGSATIQINETPEAMPGKDANNCGLTYILNAQVSIKGGEGKWELTNGPGSATFDPTTAHLPQTEVTVDVYGKYEFTWIEMNGSCSDQKTVEVGFFQEPRGWAGEDALVCDLEYKLNAAIGNATGTWSQFEGPGEVQFSPNIYNPKAVVTVSEYGTYQFQWTEENDICISNDMVEVTFRDIPALNAGRDTSICLGDELQLQAIGEGDFLWSPTGTLSNPSISNPIASPTEGTVYTVTLTDIDGCVNSDEVTVTTIPQPIANAGKDTTLLFTSNYQTSAMNLKPGEIGEWRSAEGGAGVFSDSAKPVNIISKLSVGQNIFEWTVSNGVCPEAKDILTITVNGLEIPTLITPNGDDINDYFEIRGIESLGKVELVIFDRRGVQVFKDLNYNNKWNGVDQNGKSLSEDTYYFSIKPTKGDPISGYIVIRR